MRFIPVGVPYHSHLLEGCTTKALAAMDSNAHAAWSPSDLSFAVYNTFDGTDLRLVSTSADLLKSLFDQVLTAPIFWAAKATAFPESATHALDFGTGGSSGIGSLCVRNWEGRGIRTIMVGNRGEGVGAGTEAWGSEVKRDSRWTEKFRPRLIKTSDGKIHIDTPFSRLLSKPPLMVAGMYAFHYLTVDPSLVI
jgi:fatty acid synthase subunit beta